MITAGKIHPSLSQRMHSVRFNYLHYLARYSATDVLIQPKCTYNSLALQKWKKERSSPGLRTWSPTVLLAWPEHA